MVFFRPVSGLADGFHVGLEPFLYTLVITVSIGEGLLT
jgi:hypothetical protein